VSVWDEIRDALRAGEDPVVHVSYRMLTKIVRPEKKRKGPAPKRVGTFSLHNRVPMGERKTDIHRCWNPYCKKRLSGRYVCGEGCRALAIEHFQTALNLLSPCSVGPVQDVPDVPIFDDQGRDRLAAAREGAKAGRDRRGRKPKGLRAGQPKTSDGAREVILDLLSEESDRRKEAR
jgi:hypothetical protein